MEKCGKKWRSTTKRGAVTIGEATELSVVGTFTCNLDVKSRFVLPTSIRDAIDERKYGSGFCMLPGRISGSMAIYPDAYYEQVRPKQISGLVASQSVYEWQAFVNSQTIWLKPDAQNRVLLPEWVLERCEIAKSITLSGAGDHVLLWRPEAYREFMERMYRDQEKLRHNAVSEVRTVEVVQAAPAAVALTMSRSE